MSKKLRVAVIGAGRIGKLHANNLKTRVPNVELAAVSDVYEPAAKELAENLGINFAEAVNLTAKPVIKPALADLMNTEGISAIWVDFDEIRNWLLNDENGVFAMAMPMAKMMGFGEVVEAVRDVLTAEFSVPSMSFMALTPEEFRFEFANASINPENGLFAKLIGVYLKFMK